MGKSLIPEGHMKDYQKKVSVNSGFKKEFLGTNNNFYGAYMPLI